MTKGPIFYHIVADELVAATPVKQAENTNVQDHLTPYYGLVWVLFFPFGFNGSFHEMGSPPKLWAAKEGAT